MGVCKSSVWGPRILIVDPDPVYRAGLVELLVIRGFDCVACATLEQAAHELASGPFSIVWTEWNVAEEAAVAQFARQASAVVPTYLVTASFRPIQLAPEALEGVLVFAKSDILKVFERLDNDTRCVSGFSERSALVQRSA
jgi:DNA-binding NtrC family response regulator